MATIQTRYSGDLRTEAQHVQSGNRLITDAPTDNQGKGEAFSPTDLLATSLGSCILTIMGIAARASGFSIDETIIDITKIMAADPRRVAEIRCEFYFPDFLYSDKQKKILIRASETCPVAKSLHPDLKQTLIFHWAKGK